MAPYAEGSLFWYSPNQGAPIAFAVLFFCSGLVHLYECIRFKSFKVTFLLVWAPILFTTGFTLRAICAWNYDNTSLFIAENVLLLLAPPVYEGANFIILGRILYYVPYLSPIHPGRVVTTFLGFDLVVGALTGNGASRISSRDSASTRRVGEALLKAALITQLVCMVCFIALTAVYHRRVSHESLMRPKLLKPIRVLYVSCTLISVRTIYRIVEYFASTRSIHLLYSGQVNEQSQLSAMFTNEWFFWVFEASVMLINSVILNAFHPMRYLPESNKIYLDRDGATEVEGPGIQDKRHFLLTIIDPFDIAGLIAGRDKEAQFWENHERG
ncbi:RTA1 like protein-domain-containing protein [Kockovaella imperatae]|uniref:RTA1 like protein-domain-containing protein n=1 Tax=Kockovaella imperatae TaxID=4999 RepID=A0A1Y1UG03_9TREE|nr:RTA1 like protein-domain-containing protein [Kockovaella imperatae]ORX36958.1 RTA1 like protein-domain-containing protein [Kockovaella imperatae]